MIRIQKPAFGRWIIPLLILLFSASLRVLLISKGPYHLDCLTLIVQASKTLDTHRLHGLFGTGYPLTVILASLAELAARFSPSIETVVAVNCISVLFSLLGVLLLYLLARDLLGETTAVLTALMFSVSPIFLGLSVYANSHTICIFFLLLGVLFLVRDLNDCGRNNLWWASLSFGLMGASRVQDLVL